MIKYEKPSFKILNLELKKISKKVDLNILVNCIKSLSLQVFVKYKGYFAEVSSMNGEYYCDGYVGGHGKEFYIELNFDNNLIGLILDEIKAISISDAKAAYGRTSEHITLYMEDMFDNTGSVLENEYYKPFPVLFSDFDSWYELTRYPLTISVEDLLVIEDDWERFAKSLIGNRKIISANQSKGLKQQNKKQLMVKEIGMGFIEGIREADPSITGKEKLAEKIFEKLQSMEEELKSRGLKIVTAESIRRNWLKNYEF